MVMCCPCLVCCLPSKSKSEKEIVPNKKFDDNKIADEKNEHSLILSSNENGSRGIQDYEDLEHLAQVRQIRVTIQKGTKAGIAAGLTVTAGTIMAGPVGAILGGAIGTAMAVKIAKDVVPLKELLANTPPENRQKVLDAFNQAFREEFLETVQNSPELKLILSGQSIFGVVRYMVDRDLVKTEKLEKLDGILKKIM